MARAINDINLVRQLVGMGLRTILVHRVFGGGRASPSCSRWRRRLTLLLLLPLPLVALLGWSCPHACPPARCACRKGFASLSEQVQENLNGIRTMQALVQEAATRSTRFAR